MKATTLLMLIAAMMMLVLTGCDIEEAIEDLTSRKITVNHTVFDGESEGVRSTSTLAENVVVRSGIGGSTIEADLDNIFNSLICYSAGLEPVTLALSGKVINQTSGGVTLWLALGATDETEDEAVTIGSIFVPGGQSVTFKGNREFEESSQQIQQRLAEFFADHPGIPSVVLYGSGYGSNDTSVRIEWIDLSAAPVYRILQPLLSGYSGHVRSVDAVSLHGSVQNNSDTEMRFILAIGENLDSVNFATGTVADGFVAPGENVDVRELVVQDGLARVKHELNQILDSGNLFSSGNLFLLSQDKIQTNIHNLEIEAKLTVGL